MSAALLLLYCAVLPVLPGLPAALAASTSDPPVISVTLADFESPAELSLWEVAPTLSPMGWTLDTEHVRHGRKSARLTVPSVSEGGVSSDETYKGRGWPAVALPAERMAQQDWSIYRHLVFEVFNPGEASVPMWIRFGDHPRFEKVSLQAGWQTVRAGIDHISDLDELRFFFADPVRTSTIHLDHLRLEIGDVSDVRQLIDEAAGSIRGIESERRVSRVRNNLEEIGSELDGLVERWPEIVAGGEEAAAEVSGWVRQVRGIKERLERLVPRAQAARFAVEVGDARWGYGWIHGLTKVLRDAPAAFPGEIGGTLRLQLAANESEGVQLVLRYDDVPASYPLRNVRVTVSDLSDPAGNRLSSDQIDLLPVGYVNTRRPPYQVRHVGWWPDPLLNFLESFELDVNVWQPVWIDVRTSPDQQPGVYSGTITVTAEADSWQPPPLEVPFEVEVWDLRLPVEHHFPLSLTYWPESSGEFYFVDRDERNSMLQLIGGEIDASQVGARARRVADLHHKCVQLVLDHRMFPDNIFRYREPPPLEWVQLWHRHGARRFVLLAVQAYGNLPPEEPYPAGRRKVLFDALARGVPIFEKAGLLDLAYIFTFDEVGENRHESIVDIHGEIKRLYPTIPLMTTAYDRSYGMDTGLDPYVDIWVPGINAYAQTTPAIKAARERGREIWWYIHSGPDAPYPNVRIEDSGVEGRLLMGFMPFESKSDGFLYWCLNQWAETITRGPLTNARGKGAGAYNGAGIIFYPGPDGPMPTIRMKNMRDGLEDFEYLWMLEQATAKVRSGEIDVPEGWLGRAEAALAVDIVRSVADYDREPEKLLTARREIAGLLAEAGR